ncbi:MULTISPECIES: hypothetical protein [Serratia]|uniref:hypothetical protein n=1 Tax=Serratia TaxID=613 RepID=UPI0021B729F7|nr:MULTISPECIES: hypothetical protein [Serratia]
MKFADLPEEVRQAALNTLKLVLAERVSDDIKPTKALARGVTNPGESRTCKLEGK